MTEPNSQDAFAASADKALSFLTNEAGMRPSPKQEPLSSPSEDIHAHIKQILPAEESEEEKELIFLAYDLGRITIGTKSTDSKGNPTYAWNVHSTNGNSKGTFFNAENGAGVVKATHARRLPNSQVLFADEHAGKEFLEEGFIEDVFPTFADALGFLRRHPHPSFARAYKHTFRRLDRAAINLFNQLRDAFRFTSPEDPIDLERKINQLSPLPNIRQLIGDETAAYWQQSTASSLRLKTSHYHEQTLHAERRGHDSQRFNRPHLGLKEHLAPISEKPLPYADESKMPNLGEILSDTVERLMQVYTATHPSSTILLPLIYSGDAATSETGQNLRHLNKTARALIRYFGHETLKNGQTLREQYDPWRKYEESSRKFGKTPLFFHFPSWQPLYEQGKEDQATREVPDKEQKQKYHITIEVRDMMEAIKTIEGPAAAGRIITAPGGIGTGTYAEFEDTKGNVVGLWQPKNN